MKENAPYYSDLKAVAEEYLGLNALIGKKILVTGASGLIGSAVIDFLCGTLNMNSVYAAGRDINKLQQRFAGYDCCYVDYDATSDIRFDDVDFDYIIHAASPANPRVYGTNPVETMLANMIGVNNLAQYVIRAGKGRILFVSSSEVYGKNTSGNQYKETDYGYVDILNSRSCYPSSKRAAETLLASYKQEYGLDFTVVRPGHIYGPTALSSDNRVSSAFFYDVLSGKDIIMKSSGVQRRSYCYVVDCVSAILISLVNGASGEAYNISNEKSICTIRALAESIAQNSGRQVLFENPTDSEKSSFNPMDNSALDAERLENLGWHALFDLDIGVKHTLDSLG